MPHDTPTGFPPDLDAAARERSAEHARQETQGDNELACIKAVISGLKERAERAEAEVERLRAMVEWRVIETVPIKQQIMLADMSAGNRCIYIVATYPGTGPGRATHWLPMLPLPNPSAQAR